MRLIDAAIWAAFIFAGAFVFASLKNDFCAAWRAYQELKKGPRDDD